MTVSDPSLTPEPHTAHADEHEDHRMFGFVVFLLSESVIFFSFFVGYIVYKLNAVDQYSGAGV